MALDKRIKDAEIHLWGVPISPARIISVLKHSTWRDLTEAELDWVQIRWDIEHGISPETRVQIDRLYASLPPEDVQALIERHVLSDQGQAIWAQIYALEGIPLGTTQDTLDQQS